MTRGFAKKFAAFTVVSAALVLASCGERDLPTPAADSDAKVPDAAAIPATEDVGRSGNTLSKITVEPHRSTHNSSQDRKP